MKTLLKISCVLAIALFVSMSVNGQNLTPTGSITVNVPQKLELVVPTTGIDVLFTQNYGETAANQSTLVQIKSNVKWVFTVTTSATTFTAATPLLGETAIPVSNVTMTGLIAATLGEEAKLEGSKDMAATNLVWHLADLHNVFADTYTAPIAFTLAKQ
jgi:hypothetical protein